MSLSNSNIARAKQILNKIVSCTNELHDVKKIKLLIDNDENMLSFFQCTNIGIGLYDTLESLLSLVNDVYNELDSLNNHTYNFLNRQIDSKNVLFDKQDNSKRDLFTEKKTYNKVEKVFKE